MLQAAVNNVWLVQLGAVTFFGAVLCRFEADQWAKVSESGDRGHWLNMAILLLILTCATWVVFFVSTLVSWLWR